MATGRRAEEAPDPVALLNDVPAPLLGELLRAVRRATDRLPRTELPAALRPFAGWTPESLAGDRPRQVIARAVVTDPRFREEIAGALEDPDAVAAARELDARRLADRLGEETAVAALAAVGRWDALGVVAAAAAERLAARDRTAAEASRRRRDREEEGTRRRLAADLADAREERDMHRRRADSAEERLRGERDAIAERDSQIAQLRHQVAELEQRVTEERRRREQRVARLQRRLEAAEVRARVDEERARGTVDDLERLTADLRRALAMEAPGAVPDPGPPEPGQQAQDPAPARGTIPRSEPAATPGRPCRLPPGIGAEGAAAVRSLLQVRDLEVVLDGYNVTKDPRGRPHAGLAEQRRWLVKLAAGVAARWRRRLTIVFDGTDERSAPVPTARGVRVLFTAGEEIADERIVAIVESLSSDVPVLVVSSDREVRDAVVALGANAVSSGAFLAAVES